MYKNNCDLHQKNTKCEHEKVEKGWLRDRKQKRSQMRSLRYVFFNVLMVNSN